MNEKCIKVDKSTSTNNINDNNYNNISKKRNKIFTYYFLGKSKINSNKHSSFYNLKKNNSFINFKNNNTFREINMKKQYSLPRYDSEKSDFFLKKKFKNNLKKNTISHKIIDINKEFIKKIKEEMEIMSSKPSFFTPQTTNNKKINFESKINEEKIKKKMEKINKISPLVFKKILKTKKKLPNLFKNIQNSVQNMNSSNKNKSINLNYILLLHNSTVRKSISQFKVKKYFFKQSLQLKDRPIFSASIKKNNNNPLNFSNKSSINFYKKSLINYNEVYL